MTEAEAEEQAERIRWIMAETREPFGPAVDIYIQEKYGNKPKESK